MQPDSLKQLLREITAAAKDAVWDASTTNEPDLSGHFRRLEDLQETYCEEFPRLEGEVRFWENLWWHTERVRDQWDRVERGLERRGEDLLAGWQDRLDERRAELYLWMRGWIEDNAPRVPQPALFKVGIERKRPDMRGLHERIEGLYEALKRMGDFPEIRRDVVLPEDKVNFGIIYGGGWNVSTYSVLREAAKLEEMNAFCAFDHPGDQLWGEVGGRTVRLATAGMCRLEEGRYALATFRHPQVLHFICPHSWTGPPPHTLGVPLLRSDLTLEVVNDKINTTRALEWYRRESGADIPLIPEQSVEAPENLPAHPEEIRQQARDAILRLERRHEVRELVVKPAFGMEEQDVGYFCLPEERPAAVEHAIPLVVESGAVFQERIRPAGGLDYNWRVMIAPEADGTPRPVGRFARVGHREEMEMVPDGEMLSRVGMTEGEVADFLQRLNRVSIDCYHAVAEYARAQNPDFPHRPLGGGSYADPCFLGMDLIGDARVMEVNGHEVAGMWTDDRLYPETRGRSNRTVLEAALRAGRRYKNQL